MELLNLILNIIIVLIAIVGIIAWKIEYLGKRKIDVTEEAIYILYKCINNIKYLRSSGIFGEEKNLIKDFREDDFYKENNISEDDHRTKELFYMCLDAIKSYEYKYEKIKEDFVKLILMKYKFIYYYKNEYENIFDEIENIIEILNFHYLRLTTLMPYEFKFKDKNKDKQDFKNMFREDINILKHRHSEKDEIDNKLDNIDKIFKEKIISRKIIVK